MFPNIIKHHLSSTNFLHKYEGTEPFILHKRGNCFVFHLTLKPFPHPSLCSVPTKSDANLMMKDFETCFLFGCHIWHHTDLCGTKLFTPLVFIFPLFRIDHRWITNIILLPAQVVVEEFQNRALLGVMWNMLCFFMSHLLLSAHSSCDFNFSFQWVHRTVC